MRKCGGIVQDPTGGAASPDESVSILDGAISAVSTVTDKDGDISTASVAIGHLISFQDDGPTAVAAKTVTMSNAKTAEIAEHVEMAFLTIAPPGI